MDQGARYRAHIRALNTARQQEEDDRRKAQEARREAQEKAEKAQRATVPGKPAAPLGTPCVVTRVHVRARGGMNNAPVGDERRGA